MAWAEVSQPVTESVEISNHGVKASNVSSGITARGWMVESPVAEKQNAPFESILDSRYRYPPNMTVSHCRLCG